MSEVKNCENDITIFWIKRHSIIYGNEKEDKLAKKKQQIMTREKLT